MTLSCSKEEFTCINNLEEEFAFVNHVMVEESRDEKSNSNELSLANESMLAPFRFEEGARYGG